MSPKQRSEKARVSDFKTNELSRDHKNPSIVNRDCRNQHIFLVYFLSQLRSLTIRPANGEVSLSSNSSSNYAKTWREFNLAIKSPTCLRTTLETPEKSSEKQKSRKNRRNRRDSKKKPDIFTRENTTLLSRRKWSPYDEQALICL